MPGSPEEAIDGSARPSLSRLPLPRVLFVARGIGLLVTPSMCCLS